ncbi:MAG: cytochrome c biogenesis protein CcsA [Actinomycetota bacterium]|nr:cytochrome c biogenesis protein CcsA [Actinomycetota bacterium]
MERLSVVFMLLSIFAYPLAFLAYLEHFFTRRRMMAGLATAILAFGLAAQTISFIFRMSASGHLLGASAYESLALAAWFVVLGNLMVERYLKIKTLGLVVTPVALLFLLRAYSYYKPPSARVAPISGSFVDIHFISMFTASAAFAIAAASAILYLIQEHNFKKKRASGLAMRLPSLSILERAEEGAVILGFIFLTITLITGAIRANQVWGTFVDAIVIASGVAWLIYLAYILLKMVIGLRGRKPALLAIIGFGVILAIRFAVVPYLSYLHGYRA